MSIKSDLDIIRTSESDMDRQIEEQLADLQQAVELGAAPQFDNEIAEEAREYIRLIKQRRRITQVRARLEAEQTGGAK